VVKHFVPSPDERARLRWKRKIFAMRQFHDVLAEELDEAARRMRGKLKFYSYPDLREKIRENTFDTIFIVRTYKPIRWIDFIRRVSLALEDLL